jgi:hypothetical protein
VAASSTGSALLSPRATTFTSMGRDNRQRRAAKAKKRARPTAGASSGTGWGFGPNQGDERPFGPQSEQQQVASLVGLNQLARGRGNVVEVADTVARLARCSPVIVDQEIERDLSRILLALWQGGWLPGEVIREARRSISAAGERLVTFAVAADHNSQDPGAIHPKWQLHVDQLELPSGVVRGWLRSFRLAEPSRADSEWPAIIEVALATTFALCRLGRLGQIIPPPGTTAASQSIIDLTTKVADPILTRVRRLLAQAESTNFDAEAEAFSAKAQELMARHAIDAAVVWDKQRQETPTTIRVPLDEPYVDAKSLLVTVVAEASQCRAVIDPRYGLASMVGFEGDLLWCETMYTSLLVQAQREMKRAGAGDQAGGRRRSRSFRASFLMAYAHRIGERLAEVNAHVQGEASVDDVAVDGAEGAAAPSTSALLPVLARRRSAVDDAVDSQFGELSSSSVRGGNDAQGWHAGRQAADRARLTQGELLDRHAS